MIVYIYNYNLQLKKMLVASLFFQFRATQYLLQNLYSKHTNPQAPLQRGLFFLRSG